MVTLQSPSNIHKFALIDVNNFFVSCERVFMPRLQNKPVLVLSNNDGCVIARSNESKNLGIQMGVPYFQIKHLVKAHKVEVFSSNFALYGDMSARVMAILKSFAPTIEIYSIDEAFLDLTGFEISDPLEQGRLIHNTILKWIGLPVSVGIGPTKTLAKIANLAAKQFKKMDSVFDISSKAIQDKLLPKVAIQDIWGIGYRWADQLKKYNIQSADDLRKQDALWVQKKFNKILALTTYELQGIPCFGIEAIPSARKRIMVSRSFRQKITELEELKYIASQFVVRAAEQLRRDGSLAQAIHIFIRTSHFNIQEKKYANSERVILETPTDNTSILIEKGLKALQAIFKTGYFYHKLGIMLVDLIPKNKAQIDFFSAPEDERSGKLMQAVDGINCTMGKNSLRFAREGFSTPWFARGRSSPLYTTSWDELPIVKA